jgi:hypothetical protein
MNLSIAGCLDLLGSCKAHINKIHPLSFIRDDVPSFLDQAYYQAANAVPDAIKMI